MQKFYKVFDFPANQMFFAYLFIYSTKREQFKVGSFQAFSGLWQVWLELWLYKKSVNLDIVEFPIKTTEHTFLVWPFTTCLFCLQLWLRF